MSMTMQEINESPSGQNFDQIISDLDNAYRDGNQDEIVKLEAEYEIALNNLDESYRHNENVFFPEM